MCSIDMWSLPVAASVATQLIRMTCKRFDLCAPLLPSGGKVIQNCHGCLHGILGKHGGGGLLRIYPAADAEKLTSLVVAARTLSLLTSLNKGAKQINNLH